MPIVNFQNGKKRNATPTLALKNTIYLKRSTYLSNLGLGTDGPTHIEIVGLTVQFCCKPKHKCMKN